MKCTVIIDKSREEEVIVYAHSESDLTKKIEEAAKEGEVRLLGFREGEIVPLIPDDVICFSVVDGHVMAATGNGKYRLRERLCAIEEVLPSDFVRINQSCIANLRKILRFEASYGGALRVVFKNGDVDYVSRRQLKNVKRRLGF